MNQMNRNFNCLIGELCCESEIVILTVVELEDSRLFVYKYSYSLSYLDLLLIFEYVV